MDDLIRRQLNSFLDYIVEIQILHGKPFVTAIEIAINREIRSPNQRIREQLIKIQDIIFDELRNTIMEIPTDNQVNSIMVRKIFAFIEFLDDGRMGFNNWRFSGYFKA